VGLIVRPNFVSDVGPCIIVRIATLLSPITAASVLSVNDSKNR
jgi:hypothetical protein